MRDNKIGKKRRREEKRRAWERKMRGGKRR